MATLVKKLSVATVVGKPSVVRALPDGAIFRAFGIMRGIQRGVKIDQDAAGNPVSRPWVAFIGSFQGTNLSTGEIFASAKMFLPEVASNLVEQAFISAQEGDNPVESMKFAFDIKKVSDETSATGYVYSAVSLIETKESDPLNEMAAGLPPAQMIAQLPAPAEPEKDGNKTKK